MKKYITIVSFLLPFMLAAQTGTDVQQLLRYRKYVAAENEARTSIATDANNTAGWYWLSQVLSQAKDSVSLAKLPAGFPSDISNDAWLNIAKGNVSLATGKTAEARAYFNQALDDTRNKNRDIQAAVARANIYSPYGDKAFALEVLKKATRRNKHDAELYTLQGDAYFRLKDGSQAYQAFEQALKINPSYAPALYEMGKIFATQNNEELYLDYFTRTIQADPSFVPALYDLYYHYYKKDITKAYDYFKRYMALADVEASDEYQLADMLYLTKQYPAAIRKANALLAEKDAVNRLNKLVAYTYKDMNQPDSAVMYMQRYFQNGADSAFLQKDYEFMAGIFGSMNGMGDSVAAYYQMVLPLLSGETERVPYYAKLAAYYKEQKDAKSQSVWLEKYYREKPGATNLDLFNWGLSLYQSQQYAVADSVFGYYSTKYPEHVFGYYWQARTNAAIDSSMTQGLAIPYYRRLIEVAV